MEEEQKIPDENASNAEKNEFAQTVVSDMLDHGFTLENLQSGIEKMPLINLLGPDMKNRISKAAAEQIPEESLNALKDSARGPLEGIIAWAQPILEPMLALKDQVQTAVMNAMPAPLYALITGEEKPGTLDNTAVASSDTDTSPSEPENTVDDAERDTSVAKAQAEQVAQDNQPNAETDGKNVDVTEPVAPSNVPSQPKSSAPIEVS